jgi:transposase
VRRWSVPTSDPTFVAAMEDVLAVYARPLDPARPLVCFDESGKELQRDVRPSLPPSPAGPDRAGTPARIDTEYARNGSANLFLWCAPLLGRRGIETTERRTSTDWAVAMRHLVDEQFPTAERSVLVLDNLNTHTAGALYAAFPAAIARRLLDKLEFHYTPKHGSWLNIAECELSVLRRQALAGRIPDRATLATEVAAWTTERNRRQTGVTWRFTTDDARIKLRRLYPEPKYDK